MGSGFPLQSQITSVLARPSVERLVCIDTWLDISPAITFTSWAEPSYLSAQSWVGITCFSLLLTGQSTEQRATTEAPATAVWQGDWAHRQGTADCSLQLRVSNTSGKAWLSVEQSASACHACKIIQPALQFPPIHWTGTRRESAMHRCKRLRVHICWQACMWMTRLE